MDFTDVITPELRAVLTGLAVEVRRAQQRYADAVDAYGPSDDEVRRRESWIAPTRHMMHTAVRGLYSAADPVSAEDSTAVREAYQRKADRDRKDFEDDVDNAALAVEDVVERLRHRIVATRDWAQR